MPVTTPADGAPPQSRVHAPGGPQAQLEEGGAGIEQPGDAFAGGEAALVVLAVDGLGAAALADQLFLLAQLARQRREVGSHACCYTNRENGTISDFALAVDNVAR